MKSLECEEENLYNVPDSLKVGSCKKREQQGVLGTLGTGAGISRLRTSAQRCISGQRVVYL